MIKKIIYSVFLIFGVSVEFVFGQDVSFSQFYTNPLYLNPAFAGSIGVPRVALQYRNQWQSFHNAYTTYSAAFDLPVQKLQGGIGLHVMNDAQGSNLLNSLQVNALYSVYVKLSKTYTLHGGMQVGFNQNSMKVNELVFPDNVDPNFGKHGTSGEVLYLTDPNYAFVDFASGILVYSKRIFFGFAAHHLTEPHQTFYSGQEDVGTLYRKYTAHFGARLPIFRHGHHRKEFDISPQLIVQQQGPFQQINYGMFATKHGFTGGAWFRQNFGLRYDAVIFLVGFIKHGLQITYSYDLTVSGLWGDTGGTSEISLAFLLKKPSKKRYLPFFNQYEDIFGVQ
ncbi:MAG: PorP/SprF family type IX secretion system membrane protein [Prolixibacteraceae bacterium]|nr:PorP/SprF family type IX secretion system membrane protein [Prolixibacteraceae bacterium]